MCLLMPVSDRDMTHATHNFESVHTKIMGNPSPMPKNLMTAPIVAGREAYWGAPPCARTVPICHFTLSPSFSYIVLVGPNLGQLWQATIAHPTLHLATLRYNGAFSWDPLPSE